jgi:hypothetical protein
MRALLESSPVVVGEIYPRAAYATSLLEASNASRSRLKVAKTYPDVRGHAIAALQAAQWVRKLGVTIENLVDARANEDDFDACMTAAALLRCTLEKLPLCPPRLDSARAEGGMLGTGSVNLGLPEHTFGALPRGDGALGRGPRHGITAVVVREEARIFAVRLPVAARST